MYQNLQKNSTELFLIQNENNNNNNNNRDSKNNNINNTSRENECNRKTKIKCPMNGFCNLENVIYQGIIFPKENINNRKTSIGISSTKWKLGFDNHNHSFSHEHLKYQTALSKHFWKLKNKGLTPEIQWSILKRSNTLNCFDSRCNLCQEEKMKSMLCPDPDN